MVRNANAILGAIIGMALGMGVPVVMQNSSFLRYSQIDPTAFLVLCMMFGAVGGFIMGMIADGAREI